MRIKLFLFVVLLCMLQTPEVESHDFFRNAYDSVKNAVVKGYHHVTRMFMKKDDNEKDNKMEEKVAVEIEEQSTLLEDLIDIRFKEINEESATTPSFRRQETSDNDDGVPDLNTRFFINVPCGEGTRKSGNGCRQVIHK